MNTISQEKIRKLVEEGWIILVYNEKNIIEYTKDETFQFEFETEKEMKNFLLSMSGWADVLQLDINLL